MLKTKFICVLISCCLITITQTHADTWQNPVGMKFVEIPAGSFTMGNPNVEDTVFELPDGDANSIDDETPAHHVTLTHPFWLGITEVTQSQWFSVMATQPGPKELWKQSDWQTLPVVSVSWNDVQGFIKKLNQRDQHNQYRLPTEAEWEYAARAGSTDARPFPKESLDQHAWYFNNSGDVAHPVATMPANAWGLYDMLGNSWEWVADFYQPDYYAKSPAQDPKGPAKGSKHVRRGGSYHCPPHLMRVNYRAADEANTRYTVLGFRLVREPK